ncbi:haloacid dehalogenase type II [Geopsychrobacter electrodiphilus]|uniref:haloacid dehalogenase type II n=1 Tax=Geopsychrobacter electrodiphilus TaxID=225196 RepID=UPI000379A077|nr:haloacid dehalogenase type II [Geopsychrobacter electrodiphilus]
MITLAFDVYGTLIDTAGVITALQQKIGGQAYAASEMWRSKQLEYSFRRGLMQNYQDFAVCTRQALDYVCSTMQLSLSRSERDELLASYRSLPAFADVLSGLKACQLAGFRLYAFSNGRTDDVQHLLEQAGIRDFFIDVISTSEISSFKPNPGVYANFLRRASCTGAEAWLISGNPFDVIGALSAGLRSAWIKRNPTAIFDPWEFEPTLTLENLTQLSTSLQHTTIR